MAGLDGKVGIGYQLLPDSLLQSGVLHSHHPHCFGVPAVSMQWIRHGDRGNESQDGHGQELGRGCPWASLGTITSEKV